MKRFSLVFLSLLVCLFALEMLTPVHQRVIEPFTYVLVTICAYLIRHFDPSVLAYGKVLGFDPGGFAVSVEAGCNGIEACIVLNDDLSVVNRSLFLLCGELDFLHSVCTFNRFFNARKACEFAVHVGHIQCQSSSLRHYLCLR